MVLPSVTFSWEAASAQGTARDLEWPTFFLQLALVGSITSLPLPGSELDLLPPDCSLTLFLAAAGPTVPKNDHQD